MTRGRAPRRDAVALIEGTIVPELIAGRARLASLARIPTEHAAPVGAAHDYFDRRERSWRLRAEGNRRSSTATLREADEHEQAARALLRELRD